MGFKIGDRVRVVAYPDDAGDPFLGKTGVVVEIPNGKYLRVDLGGLGLPLFLSHELELIPPRGPRPLTLTGGKARFTVRQGCKVIPVRYALRVADIGILRARIVR